MEAPRCRAYLRFPLEIAVDFESEHNFYFGITGDISEGGLFVSTYVPPPLGDKVTMEITLPGQTESFTVTGVVRWLRDLRAVGDGMPSGFGMEWVALSPRALSAIRSFAEVREPVFFEAA
jgi:uncharacterized protein (TIGR02266 family)